MDLLMDVQRNVKFQNIIKVFSISSIIIMKHIGNTSMQYEVNVKYDVEIVEIFWSIICFGKLCKSGDWNISKL